ncbi:phosphoadenosine phosphosulfate reductase domain-containing protein [Marinobacter nauticus]|uniref:phosphoadenosine phosphosulfate reductase domain-containing protein n=1 Tax=Marinobacter nauticus TaxID=2743 RepID=UPI0037350770
MLGSGYDIFSHKFVLFASYGNDSIALINLCGKYLRGEDVTVVYSDTGWAAPWWMRERVEVGERFAQSLGFKTARTGSIGLEQLVRDRKGWPRQGMQFCTHELKIKPAMKWLEQNDPFRRAICLNGVRRVESQKRANYPEFTVESPNHGGRSLWSPMIDFSDDDRDYEILEAGFEVLPHRSMECFPCVNANRQDLRMLAGNPDRIIHVERVEKELGHTKKGKPRVMFRPYQKMGATGIREVVRWALSDRGKYEAPVEDNCDSGWCGA